MGYLAERHPTSREVGTTDNRNAAYAALLLRVARGLLFLAHASVKIFVFTVPGTAKSSASIG